MRDDAEFYESYGDPEEWQKDKDAPRLTQAYAEFLNNDCIGIVSYDEAVSLYKKYSGQPSEYVNEWPEIDWVKAQRDELEQIMHSNGKPRSEIEVALAKMWPYEPMLKVAY